MHNDEAGVSRTYAMSCWEKINLKQGHGGSETGRTPWFDCSLSNIMNVAGCTAKTKQQNEVIRLGPAPALLPNLLWRSGLKKMIQVRSSHQVDKDVVFWKKYISLYKGEELPEQYIFIHVNDQLLCKSDPCAPDGFATSSFGGSKFHCVCLCGEV